MIINIDKGIEILKNQGVVAIPTETVYGLAASINSQDALEQIFAIKKRPFFDPLIVHVSNKTMAEDLVTNWPPYADQLANAFWPGPLTMVLPKKKSINNIITAGLNSVALRVPNHETALKIIEEVGPIAAPSANLFSRTSPTQAQHVIDEFESKIPVIDGGACNVGIESTVIGVFDKHIKIYRPGIISKEQISSVVGPEVLIEYTASPVAPGQIKHHYMPRAQLVLTSNLEQLPAELKEQKLSVWKLEDNPQLVARELYSKMRQLDDPDTLMVFLIEKQNYKDEKWIGIKNRIQKAASYNFLEEN